MHAAAGTTACGDHNNVFCIFFYQFSENNMYTAEAFMNFHLLMILQGNKCEVMEVYFTYSLYQRVNKTWHPFLIF